MSYAIEILKKEIKELSAGLKSRERALEMLLGPREPKAPPKVKAKAKQTPKAQLKYSDETVEDILDFLEGCPVSEPQSAAQIIAGAELPGMISLIMSRLVKEGHVESIGAKQGKKYRFVSFPEHLANKPAKA